jgi:hypothetical protein
MRPDVRFEELRPPLASPIAAPILMTRPTPELTPATDRAASVGASTVGSTGSVTKGSGVGGWRTGGTDDAMPVDTERAEAVSADEPQLGEERHLRAPRWRLGTRPGERPRLPSQGPTVGGSGQSRAW